VNKAEPGQRPPQTGTEAPSVLETSGHYLLLQPTYARNHAALLYSILTVSSRQNTHITCILYIHSQVWM